MNFNNFAIVSVKESDYRIHFWYINIIKILAINFGNKYNEILIEMKKFDYDNFFLNIKISKK